MDRSKKKRLMRSPWTACVTLVLLLCSFVTATAHYCGRPIIYAKPGQVIGNYVVSDRAEEGYSYYGVDVEFPEVVFPLKYTPIARVMGQFYFLVGQSGESEVAMDWLFPDPDLGNPEGTCYFDVVIVDYVRLTAANYFLSAFLGDPVNLFTGELVQRETPDLYLGGPMPLYFERYYASRLNTGTLMHERLGDNWSHNFNWLAVRVTNLVEVVSPEGLQVRFTASGTNWVLNSPTNMTFQLRNSGENLVFGDPRDNRIYVFGTNGLPSTISDGKGNVHTLTYTNDVLLSQVSDGLGRTLSFEYMGAHLLSRVSDGARSVSFRHQVVGYNKNLIAVTNALGGITRYSYNNSGGNGALLTGTVLPAGNTNFTQVYDSTGRVIQQTRLGTNTTWFGYSDLVTTVTNALGHVSSYVHSEDGQLMSFSDAGGELLSLSTNAAGQRTTVTDRAGASIGIAYDPVSLKPAAITNADGTTTRYTYTNRTATSGLVFRELASITHPDNTVETYRYDAKGNLTNYVDRAGRLTRYGYNARGQVVSLTNSINGIVTMAYEADGDLRTRSDSDTVAVTNVTDTFHRVIGQVFSGGVSNSFSYNAMDLLVSATDRRGNTTRFGYDANNRLVAVTNALNQVQSFQYDLANRITNVLDHSGNGVRFTYDAMDRVVAIVNRNNYTNTITFDARGRVTSFTDGGNKAWSMGYNNEDQLVSFTNPMNETSRQGHNLLGFVTGLTNALNQPVLLVRDAMQRVTNIVDGVGRTNKYTYNARGLLASASADNIGTASYLRNAAGLVTNITDLNNRIWKFSYTSMGRISSIIDPSNRTNSFTYNPLGQLRRADYANGERRTNFFDAGGNVSRMQYSSGLDLQYGYDALNRMTNAALLGFAYDVEGRMTNTASSGVNFGAHYDLAGRLTNVTYFNGAFGVNYSYDWRNRLKRVNDTLTGAQLDFNYDDANRLTSVVRANGVNTTYSHDAAGRVLRIQDGNFADLQYGLDAVGHVSYMAYTMPLDPAEYLANGTSNFTYNLSHQINSSGYSYDARGRMTASPGRTMSWDGASRLTACSGLAYSYDGLHGVATRALSGTTNRFFYNHAIGSAPIVADRLENTGAVQRYYVWTPGGELLYMIDAANGNAVYYFHFDRMGSTIALTSSAGTLTDAYAYSPEGKLLGRTGTNPQPFTYIGRYGVRYEAARNLYQMRMRYYDPVTARFLTRDPKWPRLAHPQSLSPYEYAAQNFANYIDPSGLEEIDIGEALVQAAINSGFGVDSSFAAPPSTDSGATPKTEGLGPSRYLGLGGYFMPDHSIAINYRPMVASSETTPADTSLEERSGNPAAQQAGIAGGDPDSSVGRLPLGVTVYEAYLPTERRDDQSAAQLAFQRAVTMRMKIAFLLMNTFNPYLALQNRHPLLRNDLESGNKGYDSLGDYGGYGATGGYSVGASLGGGYGGAPSGETPSQQIPRSFGIRVTF